MQFKVAAATVRVPADVRSRVAKQFQQARGVAIFVGKLTAAASGLVKPDGTTTRDSEGFSGSRGYASMPRGSKGQHRARRAKPAVEEAGNPANPEALFGRSARLAGLRDRILQRLQGAS